MFNTSISNSTRILVKGIATGILILLMMIPSIYVMNLVEERQGYQQDAINEVSETWSLPQTISGPFLIIPYTQETITEKKETIVSESSMILLPENLNIGGELEPVIKHRGIYKVALYRSTLQIGGDFKLNEIVAGVGQTIHWNRAQLCLGISDSRGIENQLSATVNGQQTAFDAGMPANKLAVKGAHAAIAIDENRIADTLAFSLTVNLRGSASLHILPLGKTTNFSLQSNWSSPGFTGKFLPDYQLSENGFDANWKVLHFNRDFPQVWQSQSYDADACAFGVSLVQPVDNYDRTLRSVKYTILFVGLTFAFFFLFELLMNYKVHPVQYVLIGLALVIFFTLLLSISEVLGFNVAYLISASAITLLITFYAKSIFSTWKNAALAGGFLAMLYAYIFILIQLEDAALLAGSIGLFIILAAAMYFSRKINWYDPVDKSEVQ